MCIRDSSYTYLKVDESKHCTFDEQGLNAYVTRMKQINVAEADMIGENLRVRSIRALPLIPSQPAGRYKRSNSIINGEKKMSIGKAVYSAG